MFLMAAIGAPLATTAGPLIIEETAKIPTPDPTYVWPMSVAVDGDWLLASGFKEVESQLGDNSTWLYQRQANGTWTLVRRLHQILYENDLDEPPVKVAMQGGVAVIVKELASAIFERSGTSWIAKHSPIVTDGMDVEVNGGTIVVTNDGCNWVTNAYRKGTNGAWTLVRSTPPEPDPEAELVCENEFIGGDTDVASNGNLTIVATLSFGGSARIFEGPFGTTPVMTRLVSPDPQYGIGHLVAIENNSAIVGTTAPIGHQAFTRDLTGQWSNSGSVRSPDHLATFPSQIELAGGLAIVSQGQDRLHGPGTGSVAVYQRNTNGTYRPVAKLLASDRRADHFLGGHEISGRRVVAGSIRGSAVYIYDLPTTFTQPVTMQDNFEDGNASDWTPQAGSSFAVATTTTSRVYRQSSTAGNATSLWNNTARANQSIEADIKPTAYSTTTGDKWFGLAARYIDAGNYYYVTVRNNNTVLLRKIVNGTFTTLASAPLTVTLNRSYRVRLEAIGTRLRLFVDNRLLAEASDRSHRQGQAGVIMFRTRADYDNIVVSANPLTPLVSHTFGNEEDTHLNWQTLGTWITDFSATTYNQTSTAGSARAITGIPTGSQVVHARVRRTASAGTSNWFGVAARYRDSNNYYYVSLRNNNTVSLRKFVNGAVTELDSAPLTIATNTYYRIRFEAVGTQLRAYINDVLRLDATDSSHTTGRYGPVMYRTAAQYDTVQAFEP
jgi:hypothetical protein